MQITKISSESLSHGFAAQALILAAMVTMLTLSNSAYSHSGVPNTLPWQACEKSVLGDACSYSTDTARYSGSCREMSGSLMCVRQKPIEYLSPEKPHQHNDDDENKKHD